MRSGAFTPATAPPYYHLSFTVPRLLSNLFPYADRSMTFSAVIVLTLAVLGAVTHVRLLDSERSALWFGGLWLIGGFALTVFLPVRSSLYACLPSVGVAIAATALAAAIWREIPQTRQSAAIFIGLILPFSLLPVYQARNDRLVSEAELS